GAIDIDSMPPATMTFASPLAICCKPRATDRRPEPQSWFMPHAVFSCGMPAAMAACRAGFCPSPPARPWRRVTSSASSGETLARSSAPLMAMAPNSWAEIEPSAPLNAPIGVRAADTITTSVMINSSFAFPALPFSRSSDDWPGDACLYLVIRNRYGLRIVRFSITLLVQSLMEHFFIERPFPFGDNDCRNTISYEIGERARLRHESVNAKDQGDARDRNRPDGCKCCG